MLAADGSRPVMPIRQHLIRALGVGVILSLVLFLAALHPRPDIAQALLTVPFVFKLILAVSVVAGAAVLLTEVARPVWHYRWGWPLMLAPLLLAGGVIVEFATAPSPTWASRIVGHNASHCLSLIPLLSLPPAACLFAALRRGAPMNPALAGAIAGLVSGGIGALLYAPRCPDDSPFFVATWYSIAIAIVTTAAACAGSRLLRW